MLRCFLFSLTLCFLLTGCTFTIRPDESRSAASTASQSYTISYGTARAIGLDGLSISFQDVLEDSRCPADVMCAWSGWVRVLFIASKKDNAPAEIEMVAFTDNKGNVRMESNTNGARTSAGYLNYVLTLESVTPYPAKHDQPTPLTAYAVQISVRQDTDAPQSQTPVATNSHSLTSSSGMKTPMN